MWCYKGVRNLETTALYNASVRRLSFKGLEGKKAKHGLPQDEIQRILDLESRLGVLSSVNFIYPFTGQSRPAPFPKSEKNVEIKHSKVELGVEEFLPTGTSFDQCIACQSFDTESKKMMTARFDSDILTSTYPADLLNRSILERNTILKPIIQTDVSIELVPCPVLLESMTESRERLNITDHPSSTSSLLILRYPNEVFDQNPDFIANHLDTLSNFLQARLFRAYPIDPRSGKTMIRLDSENDKARQIIQKDTNRSAAKNFSIDSHGNMHYMLYNDEEVTPAVIVTDAADSDKLIQQLLLIHSFKIRFNNFIENGLSKGYLNEDGTVKNFEVAKEETKNIFDSSYSDSLKISAQEYFELYEFILQVIENG